MLTIRPVPLFIRLFYDIGIWIIDGIEIAALLYLFAPTLLRHLCIIYNTVLSELLMCFRADYFLQYLFFFFFFLVKSGKMKLVEMKPRDNIEPTIFSILRRFTTI